MVNLEDLLHLVNAAMNGIIKDTWHHQTLYLLGINVQLLHTSHPHTCAWLVSHTSNSNVHNSDSGLKERAINMQRSKHAVTISRRGCCYILFPGWVISHVGSGHPCIITTKEILVQVMLSQPRQDLKLLNKMSAHKSVWELCVVQCCAYLKL